VSKWVKERLRKMELLQKTDHEDRVELDKKIEEKTGKYCDEGVDDLTDDEILELLNLIWKKKKKKKAQLMVV